MRYGRIPDEVIQRMSSYLRALVGLSGDNVETASSAELADLLRIESNQIRKDLSYFGAFGIPGVGYKVDMLLGKVKEILRLKKTHEAALVGFGNLGSALLGYTGFAVYGFEIVAVFERDERKVGKQVYGITINDVSRLEILRRKQIVFSILAVPAADAQETCDELVNVGVRGILNFAPCRLDVPKGVKVISIDIAADLARLPYYLPAGQG